MLHELLKIWFELVHAWGYTGVVVLMAMESSVLPVPSEVVIPPAAFWAATDGHSMTFIGVIIAGTAGSYIGSVVNYALSSWIGMPLLTRYGKYVLLPPKKLKLAQAWVRRYGSFGIFTARLLPIVRHLISIPAGALRMSFGAFSVATIVGAAIWCTVLAWFGRSILGSSPELLNSPDQMVDVIKEKMLWFVGAVVVMAALYGVIVWFKSRSNHSVSTTSQK